ncbi:conserved hypothetical protein [Talaromyces stipitatus ATCC 10500]|uniref:gamma-glutamylcyclotransferase n=1 Tax=Talaromyces stipitatus (strain ATCC 10500 / CBS 375.48 / QM 6759 / NRRL 1006) TaxID=441959 RepID=B8MST2_TALSN|nr:uncharacterized protein TSTA_006380 [Talaromyces stipitatus ATCC 10500]EED12614.1 conserved hypothetical protein [Talaromyces stipitatus ATCC 10500]
MSSTTEIPGHKPIVAQDAIAEDSSTNRLLDHNQTILQQQFTDKANIANFQPTSSTSSESKRKVYYFAYGSNLSPTQMHLRCEHDPSTSGRPLAIARIDRWRWLICERGYANIIPPKEWRIGRQSDVVFGVLYEMTPEDEYLLDGYEGVDHSAPASQYGNKIPTAIRPREQDNGAYNKWYVPAKVTKWLVTEEGQEEDVTVLVYVDEKRVTVGPPKFEAIKESLELGMPRSWVESVMRKAIPES